MKKKIKPINEKQFADFFSIPGNNNDHDPADQYDYFANTTELIKDFSIGPYCWFITDNTAMKISAVSTGISNLTPYSQQEWLDSDVHFFASLFHPEDRFYILAAIIFACDYFLKTKADIRYSCYGRMQDRYGYYRWVAIQSPSQYTTADHRIGNSLVVIHDLSFTGITNAPLLTFTDKNGREVQYFKHLPAHITKSESDVKITRREKEILKLMTLGLNTPEIATKLFISYYTVEKHKKNLRKKTNTKTASELITYILKNSLLFI